MKTMNQLTTSLQVYAPIIHPVGGENVRERTCWPDVLPPPKKKMPGRPKKKCNLEAREKKNDSDMVTRRGETKKCSRCHRYGQNKATCKNAPARLQPKLTHTAEPNYSTSTTNPNPSTNPNYSTSTTDPNSSKYPN